MQVFYESFCLPTVEQRSNSLVRSPARCANDVPVPDEFMEFNGKLLHFSTSSFTMVENIQYCQSLGSNLHIPKSKEDFDQLYRTSSKFIMIKHVAAFLPNLLYYRSHKRYWSTKFLKFRNVNQNMFKRFDRQWIDGVNSKFEVSDN